jgi:hypothetical protein
MQGGNLAKAKEILELLRRQETDASFYDSLFAHYPALRD